MNNYATRAEAQTAADLERSRHGLTTATVATHRIDTGDGARFVWNLVLNQVELRLNGTTWSAVHESVRPARFGKGASPRSAIEALERQLTAETARATTVSSAATDAQAALAAIGG